MIHCSISEKVGNGQISLSEKFIHDGREKQIFIGENAPREQKKPCPGVDTCQSPGQGFLMFLQDTPLLFARG